MQTIIAGAVGATLGAAISLVANLFVLPRVLRQREAHAANRGISLNAKDEQLLVRIYRYLMPPCFIVVFAVFSAFQFGGAA